MTFSKRKKILLVLSGSLIIIVLFIYLSVYNSHGFRLNESEIESYLKTQNDSMVKNDEDVPIIAIQQFQLRNVIQTEDDAKITLQLVKNAGFSGIELNGFMIKKVPFIVPVITWVAGMPTGNSGKLDWKKLIDESGLTVVAIHEDLGSILNDPQMIIEEARSFKTDNIVVTGMYRFDYSNIQAVLELADKLDNAGKLLKDGGINFMYHNHNCEFRRVETGETAFEILLQNTDPQYVNFEFDSYWAIEAGCDAVKLMETIGDRMKLYHINDRGTRINGAKGSILKSDCMELGTGNINLIGLISIAKKNGVKAVILETHRNWIDKSPVKSFWISSEFLNKQMYER